MRRLKNLAMALSVSLAFALVAWMVAWPVYACGFWTALILGKGAFWAAMMGMCG